MHPHSKESLQMPVFDLSCSFFFSLVVFIFQHILHQIQNFFSISKFKAMQSSPESEDEIPELEPACLDAGVSSDSDDEVAVNGTCGLPFIECLNRAASLKEAGNAAFKRNDLDLAQKLYQDGIDLLVPHKDLGGPSDDVTEEQFSSLISTYVGVQGNLCLVLFKQEVWTEVVQTTAEVLKHDEKNVKALFRRGVALRHLGGLQESRAALTQALEVDPANGPAKKELQAVIRDIKAQKDKEKAALAGAFSAGSMYDDKEKERELRLRQAREAEEKLQDDYVQSKLKRRQESKEEQTFDEYKAELKTEEEARQKEKEREEQEKKKQKSTPPAKKPATATREQVQDDEEEYDEEEQKILKEAKSRGYCYFKSTLDAETTQLIGDITPKATHAAAPEPLAVPSSSSSSVEASSWNHAGTWEERDVTAITKTRLTDTCLGTEVTLEGGFDASPSSLDAALAALQPPGGGEADPSALTRNLERLSGLLSRVKASVTEVKKMEGEAQIVLVGQGKKRQVYDFNLTLKFEVKVEAAQDGGKVQTFRGTLELLDVTPGASYEHKTVFKRAGENERVDAAVAQLRELALARVHSFFANDYLNL